MITLINGNFQDSAGNALYGFTITFTLSFDCQAPFSSPIKQVGAGRPISFTGASDSNNMPSDSQIWSNVTLFPVDSYYTVRLYSSNGIMVWKRPKVWIFTAIDGSTVDVGSQKVANLGQWLFYSPSQSGELLTCGIF